MKYLSPIFTVSAEQMKKFKQYLDFLFDYNKKVNLISRKMPYSALEFHLIDSLYALKLGKLQVGMRVTDLGSGGGFPAIPLAIYLQDTKFVLIESVGKKAEFLRQARRMFNLENVTVISKRIEEVGKDTNYRKNFDVVIARAVAKLAVLLQYSAPLLTMGGKLIAFKSSHYEQELEASKIAQKKFEFRKPEIFSYTLPADQGKRVLLNFDYFGK